MKLKTFPRPRKFGKLKCEDFSEGMNVLYVPNHAIDSLSFGDVPNFNHADCERGIVSSVGDVNVFVKYFSNKTGELALHAQATSPENLAVIT